MRFAFFINTPAQVHLYKNVVRKLEARGHETKLLTRDYGDTVELLSELGLCHETYLATPESRAGKAVSLPVVVSNAFQILRRATPDVIVDAGIYGAITSKLLRKPCIVFTDSEPMPVQLLMIQSLARAILTPTSFRLDLGRKHMRINSYKELAYLHPNHFEPDPSVLRLLGIGPNEAYSLVRFNAFDAVHDVGVRGFSLDDKRRLVAELRKYGHVFISSEKELPEDLAKHQLSIPKSKIHDVISFAKVVVTDTQTMATEAAVLGVPAVRFNTFVGRNDMGNFVELEQVYGLVFNCSDPEAALQRAVAILRDENGKSQWNGRRAWLLRDKIDLCDFLVSFIEKHGRESSDSEKKNLER